jgi:hypothetical protein
MHQQHEAIPVALAFFAVFVLVLVLLLLVWSGVVGIGTGLIVAAVVAFAALVLNALTRWSTDA